MARINLKGNKLIITFNFDLKKVQAIRQLDGRVWNAKEKHWEIPVENVAETLEALVPLGFTPHADVLAYKTREIAIREKVEAIQSQPIEYTGVLPLFDFQKKGAMWLKTMPVGLLADVPGLGKTIQTQASLEDYVNPILVLCPASLKYSWEAEIQKWDKQATITVVDGDKDTRISLWNTHPKWVIANYELLIHDFDILPKDWGAIVCDEATRISNAHAQTVKNLKTLKSKKRIALTGTPVSNSPEDIFSIMDWLVPGYLGTYYSFRQKYCVLHERWNQVVGYKNLDKLSEKINRFMLRRTKEEVFKDFPPKTCEDIVFDLSEQERELYNNVRNSILEELEKLTVSQESLSFIPVKMLRLKQLTDHPALISENGYSTKLQTLLEMIGPIIASGEKIIIFTQFSSMLKILTDKLKEYRPLAIYGDVSNIKRFEIVKEFNDDPKPRVLIMTEAGAWGLNLQSASYIFHYDMPWSVAKLQQREDRAHRYGQNKPVTVYNLIAKKTIDEYVAKTLHKKTKVSADVLGDVDRMEEAGLSTEDINEILKL